ncbi:hypothetical protein AAF712_006303 [Marasmius tenuissimus]|uniref:Uncharacterized protein n=1 Tax=Marasmius tenuissimus TaxID=585030 RepID=A0ABR2ZZ88_9AGAR
MAPVDLLSGTTMECVGSIPFDLTVVGARMGIGLAAFSAGYVTFKLHRPYTIQELEDFRRSLEKLIVENNRLDNYLLSEEVARTHRESLCRVHFKLERIKTNDVQARSASSQGLTPYLTFQCLKFRGLYECRNTLQEIELQIEASIQRGREARALLTFESA